jgi:UDP-glucose 4-epimerase
MSKIVKMAKILITGGAGFIGTYLCQTLVDTGHDVLVLDLKHPETRVKSVRYELGDVRDPLHVNRVVRGIDTVFHLAAIVSVPFCQENPVESYKTNLLSTALVAQAVCEENKRRDRPIHFIFSSSAAVYGNAGQAGVPLSENVSAGIEPLSFYAAQKLGSEQMLRIFHLQHGLPVTIFRFFNVYGLGQDPSSPYSGVISRFASLLKENKKISLHGGGEQTRDFIHVSDIVRAARMSLEDKQRDGVPINLGSGRTIQIKELSEIMIKSSRQNIAVEKAPPRAGDVMYSLAEISRAKEILKWSPQITLEQGIKELVS